MITETDAIYLIPDLSTLAMVYKSARATLDRSNTIHRADLRDILVDQLIVFQLRKCLYILFHCS